MQFLKCLIELIILFNENKNFFEGKICSSLKEKIRINWFNGNEKENILENHVVKFLLYDLMAPLGILIDGF